MRTIDRLLAGLGALLVLATVVAVILHAAGGDEPATATSTGAKAGRVVIKDFKFLPMDVTVAKGTKLVIDNQDSAPHTFTAEDKSFDTDTFQGGTKATVTLDKAGTYKVVCLIHAFMRGSVTVR